MQGAAAVQSGGYASVGGREVASRQTWRMERREVAVLWLLNS